MDIFAPTDKGLPPTVNPICTFPTTGTYEEIVDKLLTRNIRECFDDKLIVDHNLFAMLILNHKELKNFMEKLQDDHISQGLRIALENP